MSLTTHFSYNFWYSEKTWIFQGHNSLGSQKKEIAWDLHIQGFAALQTSTICSLAITISSWYNLSGLELWYLRDLWNLWKEADISSLVLLIKAPFCTRLRSKRGCIFCLMCRQDPGLSQSLCLWSQTISVSLSKQECPSLQWKPVSCSDPVEAHGGKLDVFLNGSLSLKGRHHLFGWCPHPGEISSLKGVPAFLFHGRCSAGLLWAWGENFNVFHLSLPYISVFFIHIQVPTQDSPLLWYSTNPNRFGFCFVFCFWIQPVTVNMENKYISIQ